MQLYKLATPVCTMPDSFSQPSMSKMDAQNVAPKEKLPPNLCIPESGNIVQARVIDT
jgi:hypothetical protein